MEKRDLHWEDIRDSEGDSAYNQLFALYYPRLCLYVEKLVDNRHDAEDIVQELFLKLWENKRKTRIGESLSSYLYQSARNMSLNFVRDKTNRRELLERNWKDMEMYAPARATDPDYGEALEDCISRLTPRLREVLTFHHYDGLKMKEIAEKLGLSLQTVKNQIFNSIHSLKLCFESKGIVKR
ncbi:MAG: RNA polymerase sigma-70 factor [Tannerella sp.]|jgi:RNA polymerase sigma-70 factor (ECF subfamily)|nr:RNA polymerase sigma-70 factor [Tannerella sp.]